MTLTDFIVDYERTLAYLPDWAEGMAALAVFLLIAGTIFLVLEIIVKARTRKASKNAMKIVRSRGVEAVNPSAGLVALRSEILTNIEQCQAAEAEFRKMLAEIDEELETVRLSGEGKSDGR